MDWREISNMRLAILLAALVNLARSGDEMPLAFSTLLDDELGRKVSIYFNPIVKVQKVLSLSTGIVKYKRENGKVVETHGDWLPMVEESDDDDGSKGYIFLKQKGCIEVDWKVAYRDTDGKDHGPISQRMSPSPVDWDPKVQITLDESKTTFDTDKDVVMLKVDIEMVDKKLKTEPEHAIKPIIDLVGCESVFTKAHSTPQIDEQGNIKISADFVRSNCDILVRLETRTFNETEMCEELHQTTVNTSLAIQLYCGSAFPFGVDCPEDTRRFTLDNGCDMSCWEVVGANADWHFLPGIALAEPLVNLTWHSRVADRPAVGGYAVWRAQVDRTHNNFPVKFHQINATLIPAGEGTHLQLEPFGSDNLGASYVVKVCALYKTVCTLDDIPFDKAPGKSIYFNQLITDLGNPPIQTITTTTRPQLTTKRQPLTNSNLKTNRVQSSENTSAPIDTTSPRNGTVGQFGLPLKPTIDLQQVEPSDDTDSASAISNSITLMLIVLAYNV